MEKKNSNKSKIVRYFVLAIIALLLLGGTSYAIWNKVISSGLTNVISSKTIKLEFLESNDEIINLTNTIPITDEDGMSQGDTFDFQVLTEMRDIFQVNYSLVLQKMELSEETTPFTDDQIKIYLTDKDTGEVLFGPSLVSTISDDYVLYSTKHFHSADNVKIRDKFSLRIWVDENVDGEGWYTPDTNYEYKFKIGVVSNINDSP